MFPRESGILLHPSSLPGPYGIGEIGTAAFAFVDRLAEMKQQLWQVLPLGPTGYGDSPYQSLSTFAGNEMLICFDALLRDGLLLPEELADFPAFDSGHADFGPLLPARRRVLLAAAIHFHHRAAPAIKEAYRAFCRTERGWLDDYALFRAIKLVHDLRPWTEWPEPLRNREKAALQQARREHAAELRHVKILQFLFHHQWNALKEHAHRQGIRLIGDLPIFVAHDSADVWSNRRLFHLDANGQPSVVAGVPPDYFSETGQLWGNPLYDWNVHFETGLAWWLNRVRSLFSQVDLMRIDHFRGFEKYWEIPGGETTAIHGVWREGPAACFFDKLRDTLGALSIIAEDLGLITEEVEALRRHCGFPGMRVLQFSFGNRHAEEKYLLPGFPEDCVVYTGTHDNDTAAGWFHSEPEFDDDHSRGNWVAEREWVLETAGKSWPDTAEIHWDLIRIAHFSNCRTAIVPLQDVLGLGSEARMNTPGTAQGNWQWRFTGDALKPDMIRRMKALTLETKRA